MMNRILIFIAFVSLVANGYAEVTPEEVVKAFGEALTAWCRTGEISYRVKIDKLCSGAKKCRVEDKIHAEYQAKRGLTDYETFVLDSYMSMFQNLISDKGIAYQMNNVKLGASDTMPDGLLSFVTADIKVSGAINHSVKDLFLVRDGKITGIYQYSSELGFAHLNGSLIEALRVGRFKSTFGFFKGYAVVHNESGKAGMIDIHGNTIIPCIWDYIKYEHDGSFALGMNTGDHRWVNYDLRNNGKHVPFRIQTFVIGRKRDPRAFNEGFAAVRKERGGKLGFVKDSDTDFTKIEYKYDDVSRFIDGFAYVEVNGRGMIIDKDFKPVLTTNGLSFGQVLDAYTRINEGNRKRNASSLDKVRTYVITDNCRDGLVSIRDNETELYGFADLNGRIVTPCEYTSTGLFSHGVCLVCKEEALRYANSDSYKGPYGIIDKEGNVLTDCIFYLPIRMNHYLSLFEDGHLPLFKSIGSKFVGTLADTHGNPLPGFCWDEYYFLHPFSDGLALFNKLKGEVGYYNTKGKVEISLTNRNFSWAEQFNNGFAVVGKEIDGNMKYGCINKAGVLVVPCIYDNEFVFEDGIALVQKDGRVGLIDVYGNSSFFKKAGE